MNENGANSTRRVPFTVIWNNWIHDLDSQEKTILTIVLAIVVTIMGWAFIAYYSDNFISVDERVTVLKETSKIELTEKLVDKKCWSQSINSTPEKLILYSECDGSFKVHIVVDNAIKKAVN